MIYEDGEDKGYLEDQRWWWNPGPHQFRIAKLNEDYPAQYFAVDHVSPEAVQAYVKAVDYHVKMITGKTLTSLAEFGSGGGWFLKAFILEGIDCLGLEGSPAGVEACLKRGIEKTDIIQADLRISAEFGKRYDIAVCTEVAEHIELPFHGNLIQNLINASDLVWFSTEEPGTNSPHLHHNSEMPYLYWVKLFECFNYGCMTLPDEVYNATQQRGRCIFYNKKIYQL